MQAWLVVLVAGTLGVGQQVAPLQASARRIVPGVGDRVAVGERFTITLELTPARRFTCTPGYGRI